MPEKETKEDFEKLCEFVREMKFDKRYDARSDVFVGRSPFDVPELDREVYGCRAEIGKIRCVRITHAYEYDLSGEGIA
jgi:ribosomal protein S12 methylthiotransferase